MWQGGRESKRVRDNREREKRRFKKVRKEIRLAMMEK